MTYILIALAAFIAAGIPAALLTRAWKLRIPFRCSLGLHQWESLGVTAHQQQMLNKLLPSGTNVVEKGERDRLVELRHSRTCLHCQKLDDRLNRFFQNVTQSNDVSRLHLDADELKLLPSRVDDPDEMPATKKEMAEATARISSKVTLELEKIQSEVAKRHGADDELAAWVRKMLRKKHPRRKAARSGSVTAKEIEEAISYAVAESAPMPYSNATTCPKCGAQATVMYPLYSDFVCANCVRLDQIEKKLGIAGINPHD